MHIGSNYSTIIDVVFVILWLVDWVELMWVMSWVGLGWVSISVSWVGLKKIDPLPTLCWHTHYNTHPHVYRAANLSTHSSDYIVVSNYITFTRRYSRTCWPSSVWLVASKVAGVNDVGGTAVVQPTVISERERTTRHYFTTIRISAQLQNSQTKTSFTGRLPDTSDLGPKGLRHFGPTWKLKHYGPERCYYLPRVLHVRV